MPFYVENMGAGGTELGLLTASYAVMRLIVGPIWGGLSDRVGRKPILLIGIAGYVITMIWFLHEPDLAAQTTSRKALS